MAGSPVRIEDNTTFPGEDNQNQEEYEALRLLSSGFKEQILNRSLEDLSKSSKMIVYPPYLDYLGGKNPEKDDRFVLKASESKYESGNLVGFIGYGNEQLIIESRFGKCLFLYLLEKVFRIHIAKDFGSGTDSGLTILDILCFSFPIYLKSALAKGLYKRYVSHSYNDPNLRGKLDIPRFIKEDIPFLGKIAYSRREFSFDNGITELIRCTIDYIERQKHLSFVLSDVQSEVRKVKEITTSYRPQNKKKIVEWNKRHVIRNEFYSSYRPLQTLCLDILQNGESALGSNQDQLYGVLFDCAWLWEEYVNTLIGEEFYHPQNKVKQGEQHLLYNDNENYVSPIYPDFIGKRIPRTIADAKYKHVGRINSGDKLRMIGYLWRFNSLPGYFIFPEKGGEDKKDGFKWYRAEGFNSTGFDNAKEKSNESKGGLAMVACGVEIPQQAENYGDFSEKMAEVEQEFKDRFFRRIANHGED